MRPRALLYIWIIAIIFPIAWLVHFFYPARQVFNYFFRQEWIHILAHAALFACLVILIALSYPNLGIRNSTFYLAAWVLLVGIVQEGLQHLTKSTTPGLVPSLFDLVVDLAGAAIGYQLLRKYSSRGWNFLKFNNVKR